MEIEYDLKGLPMCPICGKSFKMLLGHIRQKHDISAKEFKKKYGLNARRGICCEETRYIKQQYILDNYDLVVTENLINKGKNTRFTKT